MVADLINDENITKLIDAVIKQFGTLHVLVSSYVYTYLPT